jgi:hypothetical protein
MARPRFGTMTTGDCRKEDRSEEIVSVEEIPEMALAGIGMVFSAGNPTQSKPHNGHSYLQHLEVVLFSESIKNLY